MSLGLVWLSSDEFLYLISLRCVFLGCEQMVNGQSQRISRGRVSVCLTSQSDGQCQQAELGQGYVYTAYYFLTSKPGTNKKSETHVQRLCLHLPAIYIVCQCNVESAMTFKAFTLCLESLPQTWGDTSVRFNASVINSQCCGCWKSKY